MIKEIEIDQPTAVLMKRMQAAAGKEMAPKVSAWSSMFNGNYCCTVDYARTSATIELKPLTPQRSIARIEIRNSFGQSLIWLWAVTLITGVFLIAAVILKPKHWTDWAYLTAPLLYFILPTILYPLSRVVALRFIEERLFTEAEQ